MEGTAESAGPDYTGRDVCQRSDTQREGGGDDKGKDPDRFETMAERMNGWPGTT